MFPKEKRLTNSALISLVQKKGKKIEGRFLVLYFKIDNEDATRFLVQISKKVTKSAAKRNRLRRILVEEAKELEKKFLGGNLFLRLRNNATECDESKLINEFKECLEEVVA